jgi:GntR family transcriptional regulator
VEIELPANDRQPVYIQIADAVRAAIARGQLRAGDPLPPLRTLAPQLGVHPNTVLQAYRELAAAGVVEPRRGSGTFVRATPPAEGARRVMADDVAQRALRDAFAHGLTPADLDAALRRATARATRE